MCINLFLFIYFLFILSFFINKKLIFSGGVGRMFSRGGQLQVAGVVVGSWGPNYGSNGNDSRSRGIRHPVSIHETYILQDLLMNILQSVHYN